MLDDALNLNGESFRKAVFLDRDGTLNIERDYLIDPAEFEFLPGVPQALKRLQEAGYLLIIVTNQSGIARGYFTPAEVDRLHQHMCSLLNSHEVVIDRIEICPHHPTAGRGDYLLDCDCRKGKPGMLQRAAEALEVDLSCSFMVGDKQTDVEAGMAAGCCQSYLVLTGHGKDNQSEMDSQSVFKDLAAVVDDILKTADC